MAFFIEPSKRLIIPRWREYKRKSISFEHFPKSQNKLTIPDIKKDNVFFQSTIEEWRNQPSLATATELVNAAVVFNVPGEAHEAALFLRNNENLSPQLFHIVKSILGDTHDEPVAVKEEDPFDKFYKYIGQKVKILRHRLIEFPTNPFMWLELARLHSILGNNEKAEKSLIVSHTLSNGMNRAITRAYSRYYYHIGEFDRAHEIIRKSPLISNDPWIMATEISYAVKRDRFSPNIKKGIGLIDTRQYSPEEISELASMVGTMEMFSGGNKKAKKFVQQSLISPNDNSLAQAEWLSRHLDNIEVSPWLDKVDFAFEAKAYEFLYDEKFSESFLEGCNWIIDQPFSSRAIQFSSYIAAALTNNPKMAIEICNFGLRSNSESFEILTNMIYSLCMDNQPENAEKQMARMIAMVDEEKDKIVVLANEGLILFRKGNPVEGKKKYLEAFAIADKLKELNMKQLAEINLLREELIAGYATKESVISYLTALKKRHASFQVKTEITRIINDIEMSKIGVFK